MSELIKSQQRLLNHAGFPCKDTGVWDAASHAAMQGFSRTPAARPIAPRFKPLHPSDVLPANWRVVGSGLATRFELVSKSSVAGTVKVAPPAAPAPEPDLMAIVAADALEPLGPVGDVEPEPQPEPEPAPAPAPQPEPETAPVAAAKPAAPFKKVK